MQSDGPRKLDYKIAAFLIAFFCIYFCVLSVVSERCFSFFLTTFLESNVLSKQSFQVHHLVHFLLAHALAVISGIIYKKVSCFVERLLNKPTKNAVELKGGDSPRSRVCSCDTSACACAGNSLFSAKDKPKGKMFDGKVPVPDPAKLRPTGSQPAPARALSLLLPRLAAVLDQQRAAYESLEALGLLMNMPPDICTGRCKNPFEDSDKIQLGVVAKNEGDQPLVPMEMKQDTTPTGSELAPKKSSKGICVKSTNFASDVATETHFDKDGKLACQATDRVVFGAGDALVARDLDGNRVLIDHLQGENSTPLPSGTKENLFDLPIVKQHMGKVRKGIDSYITDLKGRIKTLSSQAESVSGYFSSCTEHLHSPNQWIRQYDECELCKEATECPKSMSQRFEEWSEPLKVDSASSCTDLRQVFRSTNQNNNIWDEINLIVNSDTKVKNHESVGKTNCKRNNGKDKEVVSLGANSARLSCRSKISQIFSVLSPYLIADCPTIPIEITDNKPDHKVQTSHIAVSDNETVITARKKQGDEFEDVISLYSLLDSAKTINMNKDRQSELTNNTMPIAIAGCETIQSTKSFTLETLTDAKPNTEVFSRNNLKIEQNSFDAIIDIAKTQSKYYDCNTDQADVLKGVHNEDDERSHDTTKEGNMQNTEKVNHHVAVKISANTLGIGSNNYTKGTLKTLTQDDYCEIDDLVKTLDNKLPENEQMSSENNKMKMEDAGKTPLDIILDSAKTFCRFTAKTASGVVGNIRKNSFIKRYSNTPDEKVTFGRKEVERTDCVKKNYCCIKNNSSATKIIAKIAGETSSTIIIIDSYKILHAKGDKVYYKLKSSLNSKLDSATATEEMP